MKMLQANEDCFLTLFFYVTYFYFMDIIFTIFFTFLKRSIIVGLELLIFGTFYDIMGLISIGSRIIRKLFILALSKTRY